MDTVDIPVEIIIGYIGGDSAVAGLAEVAEGLQAADSSSAAAAAGVGRVRDEFGRFKSAAEQAGTACGEWKEAAEGIEGAGEEAEEGLDDAADGAESADVNFRALGGGLTKLGGPLGAAGGKAAGFASGLSKVAKQLGAAGPYVIAAVLVAALAAAFVLATVAALKFGITNADAARNQKLSVEGLEASSKSLAGLGAILPKVAASTGLATADITKLATQLDSAGVKAKDMPAALQALATATAGGASESFIAELNKELAAGGKLSAATQQSLDKLGVVAAKKMLSLSSQGDKLQSNIAALFSGLDIEPLLQGLHTLVNLFDSSSATGKVMKFLFESIFQPLIDGAVKAIPKVEALIISLVTYALTAYIAFKKMSSAIGISGADIGYYAVVAVLILIGATLALVALSAVIVGVSLFLAFLPFIIVGVLIYAAIWGIWTAITAVIDIAKSAGSSISGAFGAALAWLQSLSLTSIGTDLIMGLVNGITGAAGAVLSAITGAVGGAINAAKSMLGIASPSKVFAQIGKHTGAGMAQGVDASADGVQGAMESMVTVPDAAPGAAPKGGAKGKAGAGMTITGPFNFYGVKDGEDAESRFGGLLTRILEGDVSMLGATL